MKKSILSLLFLLTADKSLTPLPFNTLVRSHVQAMLTKGYAQDLSWDDLNHGHIFVAKGKDDCYANLDEVLERTRLVLYHSAEHNLRWDHESEPAERKTPRSVVGFMDGTIEPAIDFVGRKNLKSDYRYDVYGTIGIDDITDKIVGVYNGNSIGDNTCVKTKDEEWSLSFEFHINTNGVATFGREWKPK